MKLNRLESTTQTHSRDAVVRGRQIAGESVRRVEALEGVEGDRERSLQQEIAEVDPKAVGPFEGGEQLMQNARRIAAQLSLLGTNASGLLKLQGLSIARRRIDDKA